MIWQQNQAANERKRLAHLIRGLGKCFCSSPTFPLGALQVLPHTSNHHTPGQKLLPRSAIRPHNSRAHHILAICGNGDNGRVFTTEKKLIIRASKWVVGSERQQSGQSYLLQLCQDITGQVQHEAGRSTCKQQGNTC